MNANQNNVGEWGELAPNGLPNKVIFCKKCVISNQKPISSIESKHTKNHNKITTKFKDGICDACRWSYQKENEVDWVSREKELENLCNQHRKNNGEYDVIVPASGGKDSRYVAHLLKEKYNMNPLTVTWKPHKFTDIGLRNFLGLIDGGQANIMYSPRGDVQRRLTSLAFKNIGHPFQPFIVGQRVVGPKTALKYNVKLVFYGENVAEYGNRIEDNLTPLMDSRLYTCFNFNKSNLNDFYLSGLTIKELIEKFKFKLADLEPYKSPSFEEINKSSIEVHYMSYYRKWVPQENYYYAVQNTGFTPNEKRKDGTFAKYAGIDDVIEDLHFYMQLIKFGMGRCTWDAAQEVRTDKLEREEAVALVNKYDQEPPIENLDEILDYLDLDVEEFWFIVNKFRTKNLWERFNDEFKLKYIVK